MASVFKGLNVKIDAVSVWIGGYIMRIQAANTFYIGTYSVLNTKSSFPYAVKVEGYGNTRNQRSLFQFAHVTITEHMVNAKYGTKITNGSRVQMQTAGSKKKEDWTEVSKEQLAEVKLPASFDKLKEQNNEAIAWIKVNNTNIEYPVVKTKNNEFYLNHSFDKSENLGGWIFADYKNKFNGTDKNIVIYGHNMKDNSMFGTMQKILNPEWYNNEENTNIILKTEGKNYIYKVFSIYRIENEDYYIKTEFNNDSEFEQFLNTLKARSIRDFNMDMLESDSILTLSTCDNNNKYRVVLHAKKI